MENPIKMDDLGAPLFLETLIFGKQHELVVPSHSSRNQREVCLEGSPLFQPLPAIAQWLGWLVNLKWAPSPVTNGAMGIL